MRNSIPHALLKLSSYRRHRLFFHDQYLQKRATEITSRTNKPTNSEKRRVPRKRGIDFYFLFLSLSLSLCLSTIRRAYILYKYCNRLRLETARVKMMRKAKLTDEGERKKNAMHCNPRHDAGTGEKLSLDGEKLFYRTESSQRDIEVEIIRGSAESSGFSFGNRWKRGEKQKKN